MTNGTMEETAPAKLKVLLIEDDLLFSSKISGILQLSEFQIIQTSKPAEIQQHANENQIALIILDLSLDVLDPILLIQQLKENPASSQIPMIGYAEHSQKTLLQQAQDSGCDYVVTNRQIVQNLKELVEVSLAADTPSTTDSSAG